MGSPRARLVHLGTGALGLGLIAWLAARADLVVVLANRSRGSSQDSLDRNQALRDQRAYSLSVTGSGNREHVSFAELLFTDDDEERLVGLIADAETLLVTTALKGGVQSAIALLARAVEARLARTTLTPLHLVACENTFDSEQLRHAIKKHLGRIDRDVFETGTRFISCMVDRQCNEPYIDTLTRNVVVEVEEYALWVLEHSDTSGQLELCLQVPAVRDHIAFVRDVRPVQQRKKWLVNAAHLLLALNALDAGHIRLDHYLRTDLGRQLADAVMEEAVDVFDTVGGGHYTRAELDDYARKALKRFTSHPKLVTEILSRFTNANRLPEFLRDFNGKVSRPCLQYAEYRGELPFLISRTLWMTTRLISEDRWAGPTRAVGAPPRD